MCIILELIPDNFPWRSSSYFTDDLNHSWSQDAKIWFSLICRKERRYSKKKVRMRRLEVHHAVWQVQGCTPPFWSTSSGTFFRGDEDYPWLPPGHLIVPGSGGNCGRGQGQSAKFWGISSFFKFCIEGWDGRVSERNHEAFCSSFSLTIIIHDVVFKGWGDCSCVKLCAWCLSFSIPACIVYHMTVPLIAFSPKYSSLKC